MLKQLHNSLTTVEMFSSLDHQLAEKEFVSSPLNVALKLTRKTQLLSIT